MKKFSLLLLAALVCQALNAQHAKLPRLFLDVPHFFLAAPNAEHIENLAGIGLETAMNFGTHFGTARIGGGATFTIDPKAGKEIGGSFAIIPYGLAEVGLGLYRTNGNRCASTKHNAYTAMAKVGVRYAFETRDSLPEPNFLATKFDISVGAEFGYFYITDVFKNTEIVLNVNYLTRAKVIQASFGFKVFLNLRASRD